ncbi:MAG: hypothetical protein ABEJ64_03160 [Candidatus Nanohaloarchaea archaeon]
MDSKGRITVPACLRNRLELEEGEDISLTLVDYEVIAEEVGSYREALEFIRSLDSVESFTYREGVVEVVLDG